jgi:hypothetical protein
LVSEPALFFADVGAVVLTGIPVYLWWARRAERRLPSRT